jgi:hypothetical protein
MLMAFSHFPSNKGFSGIPFNDRSLGCSFCSAAARGKDRSKGAADAAAVAWFDIRVTAFRLLLPH